MKLNYFFLIFIMIFCFCINSVDDDKKSSKKGVEKKVSTKSKQKKSEKEKKTSSSVTQKDQKEASHDESSDVTSADQSDDSDESTKSKSSTSGNLATVQGGVKEETSNQVKGLPESQDNLDDQVIQESVQAPQASQDTQDSLQGNHKEDKDLTQESDQPKSIDKQEKSKQSEQSEQNGQSEQTEKSEAPGKAEQKKASLSAEKKQKAVEFSSDIKPLQFEQPSLPIAQGERINWLSVRKWYEHAQDVVKEIDQMLPLIAQLRESFISQRDDMESKEEQMFLAFGFDGVKALDLINYIKITVEKYIKEAHELPDEDFNYFKKINDQLDVFNNLSEKIDTVIKFNDLFDQSIKIVIDQITRASEFKDKAHAYLSDIPKGTIQAKEGFYQIDAKLKSLQKIKGYLDSTLKSYFDDHIQKKGQLLSQINEQLSQLKKEGIELNIVAKQVEKIVQKFEQRKNLQSKPEEQGGFVARAWRWLSSWVT
ncbi:MAG TPA: hypothetical protein VJ201_08905 [Candidatus Babeliales bacterium]|nr:hypothetical protein [Candidatus Babeliales bacterium]